MQELKPALINVADVRLHPSTQDRAGLDQIAVAEYAESDLDDFPPIRVFVIDQELVLSVGHHTLEAHIRQKREKIKAVIVKGGTLADAILDAVKSNSRHGLRRSTDDKRRAINLLLSTFPSWSAKQIADNAGVSNHAVAAVQREIAESVQPGEIQVGHSGKADSADGKKRPASKSAVDKQQQAVQEKIAEAPDLTDRAVAKLVGCSPSTVGKIRASSGTAVKAAPSPDAEQVVPVVLDKLRVPVPEHAQPAFGSDVLSRDLLALLRRAQDLVGELAVSPQGSLLRGGSRLRCRSEHGGATRTYSSNEIWNAISLIENTLPYAGCPYCAHNGKRCTKDGCRGMGWLTEGNYKDVPAPKRTAHEAKAVPE